MRKIAIIWWGGREHVIAEKLSSDDSISEIGVFATDNPGILDTPKVRLFDTIDSIDPDTFVPLGKILMENNYDALVVWPEWPLSTGVVDAFEGAGIRVPIFWPDRDTSRLESSKWFARKFMTEFSIPWPKYSIFNTGNHEKAQRYILSEFHQWAKKIVLKADWLAQWKGVEIYDSPDTALEWLKHFFEGKFWDAGATVVIEECMEWMEFSAFALLDGTGNYIMLPSAQDHKRLLDWDTWVNTGGMGAVTFRNPPWVNSHIMERELEEKIVRPTIYGIQARWMKYRWVLYFGLMITQDGIKVIEYNIRFGDPEAEVLIPLISTPFSEIVWATVHGKLKQLKIEVSSDEMVGVVMASWWYPFDNPNRGTVIKGINTANSMPNVRVYQAGTSQNQKWDILATGWRILVVTGRWSTIESARQKAYDGVSNILFEGSQVRKDIGHHLVP